MGKRLFHINVTRQCQLACSHCYIDQAIRDNDIAMSTDTLQEIVNVIKDTHADVHIIGGEPTLVSIDTHQQYLSILSTLKNSKIMIVTALQNARAVKVAKLYQNIATSYDPNARTEVNNNSINDNNANNADINSINNNINNNKWLARCRELREQGHNLHVCTSLSQSVIDYGVSKVLEDLYQYGFKSVHLSAMVPTSNALNETPDPMITSQAMIASAQWVLDKRKTDKNINIFVSPFDGLLQGMSNYEGLRCPAGQQCVNVEPNGQIHACVAKGGEVSSDVSGEISREISSNVKDIKDGKDIKNINNINNNQTLPIKEQLSSNAYRLEVAQHNRTRTECLGCEFWTTCKGGCRVLANTDIAKQSSECAGFKTFLNYVKEQAAF